MQELCYSLDAPTGHGRRRRHVTLYAEGLLEVSADHHNTSLPTIIPARSHATESPPTPPVSTDSPPVPPLSTDYTPGLSLSTDNLPTPITSVQEDSEVCKHAFGTGNLLFH